MNTGDLTRIEHTSITTICHFQDRHYYTDKSNNEIVRNDKFDEIGDDSNEN